MAIATITVEGEGEVLVQTGVGYVSTLNPPGKRNAKLEITAVEPKLRYPLRATVDTLDDALYQRVRKAHEGKFLVEYRIETHRLNGVSGDKPIADLEKEEKASRLYRLERAAGAAQAEAPQAAPAAQQAPPPPPPAPTPQANSHQAPPAPPAAESRPVENQPDPPQNGNGRRGRIAEPRPWERTIQLPEGEIPNLGSYAVTAAVGMSEYAYELLVKTRRERGRDLRPPREQVKVMAAMLLEASDAVQRAVRPDGCMDRMDNSHTRARGAVRTVIEALGVPWEQVSDPPGRPAWVQFVAEEATMLVQVGLELDK